MENGLIPRLITRLDAKRVARTGLLKSTGVVSVGDQLDNIVYVHLTLGAVLMAAAWHGGLNDSEK